MTTDLPTLEALTARPLSSIVQPPTIRFHKPGEPVPEGLLALPCPNCGSTAPKSFILTVDIQLPDNPAKRLHVLHCPTCTAHFYDSQVPPDYAEPALNDRGRVPFYVQQGAGVSLITRPLAQLRRPAGAAYMEVGCGYGFGLDFALRTKDWHGVGIDPAPLAALGRDALQLPIELRYLRDDDEARGTMDVVMGSEVIEHVTSPSAFVRTLRAMLKPGGVLVLTTPNGADIGPDTAPGIIIPLLSPSLHLVIQNQRSLGTLLKQAGFLHVEVQVDSHSLVAFASDVPLDLEEDHDTLRHAFRSHLERRAAAMDPATDLFVAYAGRAFTESVNDDDMDAADRAWSLLIPACRARYGLSIDAMSVLPPAVATCSLEEMARLVPLDLGALFYARAIRRLKGGTPRAALEALFLLSAEAAAAMRRALGELAMEDGQTEDIGWTSHAEALLCAADAGDLNLPARIAALPPAPNGGQPRTRTIAFRAMTNLVNAGKYLPARALVRDLRMDEDAFVQPGAPLTGPQQDWLFCMAILDVEHGPDGKPLGSPAVARSRLKRVRLASPPGGSLWWAALRAETQALELLNDKEAVGDLAETVWSANPKVDTALWALVTLTNAGRYDAARAVVARDDLGRAFWAQPGLVRAMTEQERDAVFTLAVLDVQVNMWGRPTGEPAMARGRFARVRQASPAGSGLWFGALRGELQALDMLDALDEAAQLTADVEAAHPELQLPADMLARVGRG